VAGTRRARCTRASGRSEAPSERRALSVVHDVPDADAHADAQARRMRRGVGARRVMRGGNDMHEPLSSCAASPPPARCDATRRARAPSGTGSSCGAARAVTAACEGAPSRHPPSQPALRRSRASDNVRTPRSRSAHMHATRGASQQRRTGDAHHSQRA
jgi:hypothetical protein